MTTNTYSIYDKCFNEWTYTGTTTASDITISNEPSFSTSLDLSTGAERVNRLTKAGYNANAVQKCINEALKGEKPKRIKQKKKKKPFFERNIMKVTVGGKFLRTDIKKVIFNEPATIVLWKDGSKTVVRCRDGEHFDRWTGLAMCFMKKIFGDEFHHVMKTYAGEEKE